MAWFRRGAIRLLEIGEAVKALPADLLATQPAIPWSQIARMRDHLAHRYFDTAHAILQSTVDDGARLSADVQPSRQDAVNLRKKQSAQLWVQTLYYLRRYWVDIGAAHGREWETHCPAALLTVIQHSIRSLRSPRLTSPGWTAC